VTSEAPLSAKLSVLKALVAMIPLEQHRAWAWRLLHEIEERVRPLGVRLEREETANQQQERSA
jgi:hypothetical protein